MALVGDADSPNTMRAQVKRLYLSGVEDDSTHPLWRLSRAAHWIHLLVRQLIRKRVHIRSAFLAVWCLEAVVPLGVLAAALARLWKGRAGLGAALKVMLTESILNLSEVQAAHLIAPLQAEAQLGALGVLGICSALFLGFQLYAATAYDFNDILLSGQGRPVRQLVLLPAFLVWLLVLLLSGFWATGAVLQRGDLLLLPAPLLVSALTLAAALWLLPQARLHLRSVAIGAVSAAVVFEVIKAIFYFQTADNTGSLEPVYQYLLFLPVFFFWMHLMWFCVLLSATIAYVSEYRGPLWQRHRQLVRSRRIMQHPDGEMAWMLVGALRDGAVRPLDDICATLCLEPDFALQGLTFLQEVDIVEQHGLHNYGLTDTGAQADRDTVLRRWERLATARPPDG